MLLCSIEVLSNSQPNRMNGEEVRVGAIRARYFSMRIPDPEVVDEGGTGASQAELPDSDDTEAVRLDLDNLVLQHAGSRFPEWTAAEEARQIQDAASRMITVPSYLTLLADFEGRTGSSVLTASQTLELEAINAVGAEENAETLLRELRRLQPVALLGFSPEFLRTTAVNVDEQSPLFEGRVRDTQRHQQDLLDLLARRLEASTEISRLSSLPTGSQPYTGTILCIAEAYNRQFCNEVYSCIHQLDRVLARLLEATHAINEELTRRMMERERYSLETQRSANPTPPTSDAAGESAPSRGVDIAPVASTSAIPSHSSPPPPPPTGTTPPPSYPGLPGSARSMTSDSSATSLLSAGTSGFWDALSDHDSAANSVAVLPGDESATVWISDSDEEAEVGLRAGLISSCSTKSTPSDCPSPPSNGVSSPLVVETYDADPARDEAPTLICRSISIFAGTEAEWVYTYLDSEGNVTTRNEPLPADHYLHAEFRPLHDAALATAITDHAEARQITTSEMRAIWDAGQTPIGPHTRNGFRDQDPKLLPGVSFHDVVARMGPEFDDEEAFPGFRAQIRAQQVANKVPVERLSNVRRAQPAKRIGLLDQPVRVRSSMACLSAMLSVGASTAYMLFDSGSNTDSITPEYAHATGLPRIRLEEQVVLQLGCVGSRSKISYGTRAPINFGGIKGYLYLDQVNLDRYDGIIGTPFMNKHGVILDFAKREIRFPNGRVIPALTTLEEASILLRRQDPPSRTPPSGGNLTSTA
ncbi:Transposon Tf2-12 polyprotein [Mycena venus]|uniref:Transposon Tf2-12 polyprotein n=1 Tax=Mycena venus TaxID=2733690 RepID=A0A8H6Z887_9AGAR|nr:Transposon Tf2-12 polyprotein [Mycena venus]